MKFCVKCKIEKVENDFSVSQFNHSGGWCRTCVREYNQAYQKINKEEVVEKRAIYYQNNKEKIRAAVDQYDLENRDSKLERDRLYSRGNREKINNRQRTRRQSDPLFSLRQKISNSINKMLNSFGASKGGQSFLEYVSWTFEELKQHLESQFESWMTWENRGTYYQDTWDDNDQTTWTWQVDHIIPHSDLSYTSMEDENFKKCWALENLRPYSAKQNLIDGAKRTRHK